MSLDNLIRLKKILSNNIDQKNTTTHTVIPGINISLYFYVLKIIKPTLLLSSVIPNVGTTSYCLLVILFRYSANDYIQILIHNLNLLTN